ncbi:MAG: heparan-alpha-glucosaminide N-acetyltransferase [Deltaproteobacteria bacterium]
MAGSQKVTGSSPVTSTNSSPSRQSPRRAPSKRFWEIDALRGLAVLAMIVFHFAWDWAYVNDGRLGDASRFASGAIAGTFITLLGLSIALDRDRVRAAGGSQWRRTGQRVLLIGGAAVIVTLATRLFLPDEFVYFGILHLLAACTVLVALSAPLGAFANALLGLALLVVGWSPLLDAPGPGPFWAVAGWWAPRATVDWYPLAPWAGFAFLGFALGLTLYAGGRRRFPLRDLSAPTAPLRFLGRHALPVYLVHQLLLLPLAWLLAELLR